MELKKKVIPYLYIISIVVLFLYPLRHIFQGVDLWDGGYNYANMHYSGLEYMDSMWYFATWIATAVGSFLMKLPGGQIMVGMNVYTGLLIGGIAVSAYLFCTRKMKLPAWLVFIGEILAISLCWVPSSALYNYLTYALILAGTLLLYHGLVSGKKYCLVLAGVALGLNVGVRFSNLVQAGLILAVWYYAFISKKKIAQVLRETGLCMLGYFGALGGFLALMAVRYGLHNYIEGIRRLFAMTEHATDYSAASMLEGMIGAYIAPETTYWLKRFGLVGVCALMICLVLPKKWVRLKQILTTLITVAFMWYLLEAGYCTQNFRNYDSIYDHCVILFLMVIVLSIYRMCSREVEREEKLQALFVILLLCLTSLGGNNAIFSSINNLFLVLPCMLWMIYQFVREKKHILFFPFKAFLAAGVLLLVIQGFRFGWGFVYEGATGGLDFSYEIENVPVLERMHTNAASGRQLEELYAYLQEEGLGERECILYGNIPGISYYMQLPPAMNIWSDLRSYVPEVMLADLQEIEKEIATGGEKPLVILEKNYVEYMETKDTAGLLLDHVSVLEKFEYIASFMERYGYEKSYSGDKYILYK